jgi:hypothetical protein
MLPETGIYPYCYHTCSLYSLATNPDSPVKEKEIGSTLTALSRTSVDPSLVDGFL